MVFLEYLNLSFFVFCFIFNYFWIITFFKIIICIWLSFWHSNYDVFGLKSFLWQNLQAWVHPMTARKMINLKMFLLISHQYGQKYILIDHQCFLYLLNLDILYILQLITGFEIFIAVFSMVLFLIQLIIFQNIQTETHGITIEYQNNTLSCCFWL